MLRSTYRYPRERIHAGLSSFIGLPRVESDDIERAAQALDWFEQGMDLADALHLAACDDDVTFATFDRNWSPKRARPARVRCGRCSRSGVGDKRGVSRRLQQPPQAPCLKALSHRVLKLVRASLQPFQPSHWQAAPGTGHAAGPIRRLSGESCPTPRAVACTSCWWPPNADRGASNTTRILCRR